jgi:hypothetical protein
MTGNGVLAIFHTKQVESGSEFFEKLAHMCSFIKLGAPPHFSFHKPWLTEFFGCPPTFTYYGGVSFFLFLLRLQWSDQLPCKISDEQMKHASQGVLNSIWKTANPTTTSL